MHPGGGPPSLPIPMEKKFLVFETGAIAALAAAVALACIPSTREDTGPRWQPLGAAARAEGARVDRYRTRHGRWVTLRDADTGVWISSHISRADWSFDPGVQGGVWKAVAPLRAAGRPGTEPEQKLVADGGTAYRYRPPETLRRLWTLEPGDFAIVGGVAHLKLPEGDLPPLRATASVHAGASHAGRIAGTRFAGSGFSLWPGQRVERTVAVPAAHLLRFATVVEPALIAPDPAAEPVVFRVLLDGEPIFEYAPTDLEHASSRWHRVALPARRGARLRFEVSGGLALASFAGPALVPRDAGDYAVRPWSGARPNIVVFLADTFRADNLAAYGDRYGLTPYLNAIARDARLFRRAWSVGTYTLPAHASMFSGVYPHEVGIVGTRHSLPESLVTIAERLSGAGYRTGAITDSVIVSQKYGLDQGFEWFDERRDSVEGTASRVRAFLDADDGRPVFLFVHTYRTHLPYTVSDHVRWAHGEALGIADEEFWDLEDVRTRVAHGADPGASAALARDGIRGLYRGAVIDLDHAFQAIHQRMEARGLFENGYLVFTSDHGEALDEHGTFYHTGKPFEEQSRIPLFVAGPDVAPAEIDHAASLVDLAPTLADMAGLAPLPEWRGRSLLTLDVDRPALVFECKRGDGSTVAVIEGDKKVLALEDGDALRRGDLVAAFQLADDPGETRNLVSETPPAWSLELIGRVGPRVAELLDPVVAPQTAHLSAETRRQLRALGYLAN